MNADPLRLLELAAALLMFGGGVLLYRRQPAAEDVGSDGRAYGSQGAVLLIVVAVLVAIHGAGALDYHPSAAEIDLARERAQ